MVRELESRLDEIGGAERGSLGEPATRSDARGGATDGAERHVLEFRR